MYNRNKTLQDISNYLKNEIFTRRYALFYDPKYDIISIAGNDDSLNLLYRYTKIDECSPPGQFGQELKERGIKAIFIEGEAIEKFAHSLLTFIMFLSSFKV